MVELWFALLSFTLIMFAVLDGWNIGVGMVHLMVGRTDGERRAVIGALGPLWSWHEVWLIAAGGTFLLAFPAVMAAAFTGFYLALWMVLWSLVLRGISIEVGGHLDDALWHSAWDFVFTVSSVLLAVLFGAALGNVIRGVPIDATRQFSVPLFTDFRTRGAVGILDWYTLSVAGFTTVLLAAHGAVYLTAQTTGRLQERAAAFARRLWTAAALLFPVVSWETWLVRPELYRAMAHRPAAWLAIVAVCLGGWTIWTRLRAGAWMAALAGSSAVLGGLLVGLAASIFPVMLSSTLGPEHALTAYNGASARHGLVVATFWWLPACALALGYAAVVLVAHRRAA